MTGRTVLYGPRRSRSAAGPGPPPRRRDSPTVDARRIEQLETKAAGLQTELNALKALFGQFVRSIGAPREGTR
jgi:hypothetical protein